MAQEHISHSDIVQLSTLLRHLPLNPLIDQQADAHGNIMTIVTLRPAYSNPVTGKAPSFAIAYTIALNKLKGAALVNYVDEVG